MHRRARRGLLAAMVGVWLGAGLPSGAVASEEPKPERDPAVVKAEKLERVRQRIERARGHAPAAEPPTGLDAESGSWSERLATAAERVATATQRLANANAAYARARHDRDARGEDLAAIKEERVAARDEYHAARGALPELVEQARAAGVEAALLRPYQD